MQSEAHGEFGVTCNAATPARPRRPWKARSNKIRSAISVEIYIKDVEVMPMTAWVQWMGCEASPQGVIVTARQESDCVPQTRRYKNGGCCYEEKKPAWKNRKRQADSSSHLVGDR